MLPGGARWPAQAPAVLLDGSPVDLVVRPEGLRLAAQGAGAALAEVAGKRFAGRAALFELALPTGEMIEVLAPWDAAEVGERVAVRPAEGAPEPRAYPREAAR